MPPLDRSEPAPRRLHPWRYRIPPRGPIAMIGTLVYLASPVDVLPEVMLGPLGLLDDAGAAPPPRSSSTSS